MGYTFITFPNTFILYFAVEELLQCVLFPVHRLSSKWNISSLPRHNRNASSVANVWWSRKVNTQPFVWQSRKVNTQPSVWQCRERTCSHLFGSLVKWTHNHLRDQESEHTTIWESRKVNTQPSERPGKWTHNHLRDQESEHTTHLRV